MKLFSNWPNSLVTNSRCSHVSLKHRLRMYQLCLSVFSRFYAFSACSRYSALSVFWR